jgi:hypothetical protein
MQKMKTSPNKKPISELVEQMTRPNPNFPLTRQNIEQMTIPEPDFPLVIYSGPMKETSSKEGNMYDKEHEQLKHLKYRLSDAVEQKRDDLSEAFYINWTDVPKTPAEVKDRLTNGQYTLDFYGRKDDSELDGAWLPSFFSWRTKPADHEGYDAAFKLVDADRTAVIDQALLSYADGLKALQEFEAKTYH